MAGDCVGGTVVGDCVGGTVVDVDPGTVVVDVVVDGRVVVDVVDVLVVDVVVVLVVVVGSGPIASATCTVTELDAVLSSRVLSGPSAPFEWISAASVRTWSPASHS